MVWYTKIGFTNLFQKYCTCFCCSSETADNAGESQGQVLYHIAETVITPTHSILPIQHSTSTSAIITCIIFMINEC